MLEEWEDEVEECESSLIPLSYSTIIDFLKCFRFRFSTGLLVDSSLTTDAAATVAVAIARAVVADADGDDVEAVSFKLHSRSNDSDDWQFESIIHFI